MEIQTLKNFISVINEGNISAAAKINNISQSTLSRQMTELEREINIKLFDRGSRKISLTEAGTIYYQRIRELLLLLNRAEKEVHQTKILSGELYIGAPETEGMEIIASAISNLTKKSPDIRVHLYSGNAEDLNFKMNNGILDFVISLNNDTQNANFIRLPKADSWGIIMKSNDSLANKHEITPEMLENRKLIISNQSSARSELESWLGYSLLDSQITGTYNLIFNAALLVQKEIGIAIGIDKLIESTAMNGLIFKPFANYLTSHLDITWSKGKELSEISSAFLEELRKLL
ncbi:LysR family transcriptional regulator [Weissella koreensis]|uniref:LysR family transcriptional regulator n=1 Tax=Weissella koreensis TaxID=165096 RepID=A0A7H1MKD9_9LACO|nr:LysR family transcriptional regulator [Weissella koreensis]AEJ23069.1 hypothetical protein WKK_00965 [Weissella koreensis KACC 15510]AVH74668.1 LysR family transcriptional regulator [Weissella koreensis]EJF34022.1 hypothetical protein JC2156_03300 [Weissella koreensis KCTC 3621]EJF34312.1 hypothetical protein JC2156_01940 [Weissella koreensis KCTC 3621]MCZ9310513.1 LysR family transcriptional regulator [Weissella koreensis]